MAKFMVFKRTYDPITGQGLAEKVINVDEIIQVTLFGESQLKRVKTCKSRIQLKNGEIFEVVVAEKKLINEDELINIINRVSVK